MTINGNYDENVGIHTTDMDLDFSLRRRDLPPLPPPLLRQELHFSQYEAELRPEVLFGWVCFYM